MEINEKDLSEFLKKDVNLKLIEPHIYSVLPHIEPSNFFDKMARFYDMVICNPVYNRLVWGYPVTSYSSFVRESLNSSGTGWVLDAGCGSLAFSAETYVKYAKQPVVFLDQSLKLLRIAKSRLIKIHGSVPANMVFVLGDALRIPFRPTSFNTVISLNLLHVLKDLHRALEEFTDVLQENGRMSFTTLVKNNRLADRYFERFENAGEAVARTIEDVQLVFESQGIPMKYRIVGSLAFINSAKSQ